MEEREARLEALKGPKTREDDRAFDFESIEKKRR